MCSYTKYFRENHYFPWLKAVTNWHCYLCISRLGWPRTFQTSFKFHFFCGHPTLDMSCKIPVMILKNSFRLWFSKIEVFGPRAGPLFDSIISIISQIYNWSKTHLNFLSPNKPDKYKFENFCLSVEKWQISDFSTSRWVKNLEG